MKASQREQKESPFVLGQAAHPAKEEMVTQYLPLVRFVAERVHRRLPPGVDLESLIHSGVVGLSRHWIALIPNAALISKYTPVIASKVRSCSACVR
jgi:hypothetical protein